MAFNVNAAKAAGYTDQEINQYLASQREGSQQQQQSPNWLQGLLGAARNLGLGAAQDITAPLWMAGQEITHGQSPIAGVGNQANANQLQQYAQSNPFANQQQLQQMGGNVGQAATQAAKDTAGAASWMMPMSAAGAVARAGIGGAQGLLNGVSQEGANPTSVATDVSTSSGLNAISPVLGKAFQSAWGKLALGQGGSKFADIIKEVGPVTGGTNTLGNNLYNAMQPIRDRFSDLLADSQSNITKGHIFGGTTVSGLPDPENLGMIGGIMQNVGISSRDAANQYMKQLGQHLDTLHSQYLTDQGFNGDQILPLVQNSNAPVPLPVLQSFIHDLGADQKVFQNNSPVGNMARTLYGNLRNAIANSTPSPDLYSQLQGMKQAGAQISNNLENGDQSNPLVKMLGKRIERIVVNGGLLGGAGLATLAHPYLAVPGLALEAGIQPKVASSGLSFANSPLGQMLGLARNKATAAAAGNAMTTPQ